jgi:uncharacterized protein (UPF0332 family)
MMPETERYFAKADKCLASARAALTVHLTNDAGRNAYLAAYHAAQALLFERTGKPAKTHKGVHTEFSRLTMGVPDLDGLYVFLSNAYNLKAVADYETGPDSDILPERAEKAIEDADSFVSAIRRAIAPRVNGVAGSTIPHSKRRIEKEGGEHIVYVRTGFSQYRRRAPQRGGLHDRRSTTSNRRPGCSSCLKTY